MFAFFERLLDPYPDPSPHRSLAPLPLAVIPPARFWPFVRYSTEGMRGIFLVLIVLTAGVGALEALLFGFLGQIVDGLASLPPAALWSQKGRELRQIALAVAVLLVASGLHTLVKHQILAGNMPMRLRWVYHHLMLAQSMGFYQNEFSGRVAAKVMQTALAVRDMCFILCDVLVYVVVYFGTILSVVGRFDAWMLLPFLAWLVLYGLSLRFFVPRLAKVAQAQADARSLMTGRITDAYANIGTVKLFAHAGREAAYAKTAMQEFMQTVYRQMRMASGLNMTNDALNMLLVAGTCALALYLWSIGQVTIGAVAAASAMTLRLIGMAHWIMWESTALFEQVGTVRDGMNMLSCANAVLDASDAQPLRVTRGEVVFERIDFAYEAAKPVLHDLNLTLTPGEKLGLVGPSGAGKSTLVNLLLRFYDLNAANSAGAIRIDGQDIRRVTQESLRYAIGMVTQDTSLLHRSLRDNILYGRPGATEDEIVQAARSAQAWDFIQKLNDAQGRGGLDAQVGERGVKLSGGQRQRIAIARVMLKNAPILLLDEATSALDSEVEAAIQESLYRLMEGKTVIAIAHRLSTIAAMDRLVVMDGGRIVEQGRHAELVAAGGLYARLWAHQSGGFLGLA